MTSAYSMPPFQPASNGTALKPETEIFAIEELYRTNGMAISVSFSRRNGFAEIVFTKAVFGKANFTKSFEIPKNAWIKFVERLPTMFLDQLAAEPAYTGAGAKGMHYFQSPA
jgi:hypothetical protein